VRKQTSHSRPEYNFSSLVRINMYTYIRKCAYTSTYTYIHTNIERYTHPHICIYVTHFQKDETRNRTQNGNCKVLLFSFQMGHFKWYLRRFPFLILDPFHNDYVHFHHLLHITDICLYIRLTRGKQTASDRAWPPFSPASWSCVSVPGSGTRKSC